MRRNKLWVYAGTLALTAALLTGCGSATTETGTDSEVTKDISDTEEGAQIVQVTAVDGNTVTADIGEISEAGGDMPEGEGGEAPEKPEGDDNSTDGDKSDSDDKSTDGDKSEDSNAATDDSDKSEPPSGDNGEAPEKPEGDDSTTDGSDKPEMPSGDNGEAPEKPEGDNNAADGTDKSDDNSTADGSDKPEMPSGENGEMPEKPEGDDANGGQGGPGGMGGSSFTASGESLTFTLTDDTEITLEFLQGSSEGTTEDIVVGAVLEVTLDDDNNATAIIVRNLNAGGDFGGSDTVTNGTAANTIDEDSSETSVKGETYSSSGDDENALRVDGVTASLDGITVEKTGGESSNTENGDFYGANAGLLALNGATVDITNATVNTSAVNGNGVFSYGEGTTVNVSDTTIRTTENNSGGIQTTGGGTMNASNLDVETQGNSAAAIRSDRGGGTVTVDGGNYVTNGTGSPAVYCTADITVKNATLTAKASEGVVVEGKNTVSLENCDVTSSMDNTYNGDSEENIHGIMIYQSMSGDADVGEASFSAKGGSITTTVGDLFYITNTDCTIDLNNVELTLANDTFLRVEGNDSSRGWGTEGANGGDVVLSGDNQKIEGNILVDEISSLGMTLSNGSEFNGAINPDGQTGDVEVTLSDDSTWTLTGDSYVTSFDGDTANVTANGYHLYVNGEEVL
jgi:hypothetical protein